MREFDLIEHLKRKIPRRMQGKIGIGDDAAVFQGGGGELLLTTDAIVEGVDFFRNKAAPELVGRKALAINLSDIAAMGGSPIAFVVTLGISRSLDTQWIDKFYEGMIGLAKKYKTLLVGGDMTTSRDFFASIALVGHAKSAEIVSRSGAKPGDLIGVTGTLGGSILGHHLNFEPRIPEGRFLAQRVHPNAMMDISDGLLQDLEHILKDSRAAAKLDLDQIPVSEDAMKLAKGNPAKALEHALADGEDFELLFTVRADQKANLERGLKEEFPRLRLSWIGTVEPGSGKIDFCRASKAVPPPKLKKWGFSHF